MDHGLLVRHLLAADDAGRATLLAQHSRIVDAELAWSLKSVYDEARGKDPATAMAAAEVLAFLNTVCDIPTVAALAAWTTGRAALQMHGLPAAALPSLDHAIALWNAQGDSLRAATVEVTRLHALALLGRYDEAIADGIRARDTLLLHDELLVAGTIEQNIGNIYHRRDQYGEAERFLRLAHDRYRALGNEQLLAQAENGIAIELMFQHRFGDAAALYEQALARAAHAGLATTETEIEVNLGNLAFLQGRYDRALDYLERARRRYTALGMAHELATVELELADAYLELNLVPEAATLYARIIPTFSALEMRAEQAHALAYYGWTMALLDEPDEAYTLLWEAHSLYEAEGNTVGAAITALFEGFILHGHQQFAEASAAILRAIPPLEQAQAWSRLLLARWLQGDIGRLSGNLERADALLAATLADAEHHVVPQVVYRTQTSLGLLARERGDLAHAEAAFQRAARMVEELRAPLPAEEFHTAFVADKLLPYAELVRLSLERDDVVAALVYAERARSRALVDMLHGALPAQPQPRDVFEADLAARLAQMRDELNWFYTQLNRTDDLRDDGAGSFAQLEDAVRERERQIQEINRQLAHEADTSSAVRQTVAEDDIRRLQHELPADTVLIEYFSLDGELAAFVVDNAVITVHRGLASEHAVDALVEQLRFQTDTLRNGTERLRGHLDMLAQRARHYLRALHDVLLRPLEQRIGTRRLVVVPHRTLHYVPFHALHDGTQYVIEQREVCCVPSAVVLQHCLHRPARALRRALLMGVADEQTPHIDDEITALEPLFDHAEVFLNEHATRAALIQHASEVDVLHLACHGQFRPDNPLFSSLRLGDGWFTVYDAYALPNRCGLVTLSACETGVSAIAPGDELIGLARGFFSTGVPSLLVSLWTADDASTAALMQTFYRYLRDGERPAAALRAAQCRLLSEVPHPFFWSPFVLLGRW